MKSTASYSIFAIQYLDKDLITQNNAYNTRLFDIVKRAHQWLLLRVDTRVDFFISRNMKLL
jgi:hypothetical protein